MARLCDMRGGCKLEILREDDGDFIVQVIPERARASAESVEFCASGTQSPRTWRALAALFAAMEKDEAARPQRCNLDAIDARAAAQKRPRVTPRDFILQFLAGREFTSPSEIGEAYGAYKHGPLHAKSGYHSAWASPKCKALVDEGVLERNSAGHYRLRRDPPTS